MKHPLVKSIFVCFCLMFSMSYAVRPEDIALRVVPIDWVRFEGPVTMNEDMKQCALMLLNADRYNLRWIKDIFARSEDPEWGIYRPENFKEQGIRPAASAAFALAVTLKTGIFDEKAAGVSENEAMDRIVKLLKGIAAVHGKNTALMKVWGDQWQSALWTSLMGFAGWILWEDISEEARTMIASVIEYEANRFISPWYEVPYWNGTGGDSKGEENAWNSTILQIAVAMMPAHQHAAEWKRVCSELMVSSFSRKADMEDSLTVIDGRPVREWLKGYNLHEDGYIINHRLIHTDYMVSIKQNMRAYITQSLAGEPVPEAADFNFARVYRFLVTYRFPSPPYGKPGGTMYVPGSPNVYYPEGNDWSPYRYDIYYLMDVYAHMLHYDDGLPYKASEWMRLRADRMLVMQNRFRDRHMYARGEFNTYEGREQLAAWQLAEAFLLFWLDAHGAVSPRSNWLE